MIGKCPQVWNFNRLFLELNPFICNLYFLCHLIYTCICRDDLTLKFKIAAGGRMSCDC